MRPLVAGDVFENLPGGSPGTFEVVRVGVGSAIVRSFATRHEVVRDKFTGEIQAEFDKRVARTETISVNACVRIVKEGPRRRMTRVELNPEQIGSERG